MQDDIALWLNGDRTALTDATGRVFDPVARGWSPAGVTAVEVSEAPLGLIEAAVWLQRHSGSPIRIPVGVIGPRDPTPAQYALAEQVGAALARIGFALICGGRSGIMEAACKGASSEAGVSIALLPDADPSFANPWASLVLATGIGEARNAIIARSALCLLAIGDSYGTLSEVALGLQFGKTVVALEGAARVAGVVEARSVEVAIGQVAKVALGLGVGRPVRA
jgi:uncharacterized protein (TIGR00725 family)